jgi:hypothetical protein
VEFAGEFGPYKDNPAGLKAFLEKNKLQCAGAHMHFDALADAASKPPRPSIKRWAARTWSSRWMRAASTAGSAEMSKRADGAVGRLAGKGMRIGYHNHSQEFAGAVGSTPWDVIAQNTPQASIMQQDVGWTTYAGKDPVAYVKRYPGRTISSHFKAKLAPKAARARRSSARTRPTGPA